MRIKIGLPRKDPKISVEAEVSEQQLMGGVAKILRFFKGKLTFKIEVDKNGGTHQD